MRLDTLKRQGENGLEEQLTNKIAPPSEEMVEDAIFVFKAQRTELVVSSSQIVWTVELCSRRSRID